MREGKNMSEKNEFTFEIVEAVGIIQTYPSGWSKEVNLVSWNEGKPKYDIRDWDKEHQHMSRGITLHEEEIKELKKILDEKILD